MTKLLDLSGGVCRDQMHIVTSASPADKSRATTQPRRAHIITNTLRFSGSKPTRGQIKALTQAIKTNSLQVLRYRAQFHDVIDPVDILGEVVSLRFTKNTNKLVVKVYTSENYRMPSWPMFQVGYTQSGDIAVLSW